MTFHPTIRRCVFLLAACAFITGTSSAQNYIKYHQQSLVVQEHMAQDAYSDALLLLAKLEKSYRLMPTEIFAKARCLASLGDTSAARLAYLRSIEQRAPFIWMDLKKPKLASPQDSLWYAEVENECIALWRTIPQYADGPNPDMPTPTSALNRRHQEEVYDNPRPEHEREAHYAALLADHDAMFLRFVNGELPVPSIAEYGVNTEFATFVIHCSPELTTAHERTLMRWLQAGLIYPVLYAAPFDNLALRNRQPYPFGIFTDLKPEKMLSGHAESRARIGMGDERMERMRFNRPQL